MCYLLDVSLFDSFYFLQPDQHDSPRYGVLRYKIMDYYVMKKRDRAGGTLVNLYLLPGMDGGLHCIFRFTGSVIL